MGCTSSSEAAAVTKPDTPTRASTSNNDINNAGDESEKKSTEAIVCSASSDHYTDSKSSSATIGNLKIRYACLSHRGRDPDFPDKPNQDCYGDHADDFCKIGNGDSAFFACYDGHGPHGEQCSHFVRRKLPTNIKKNIEFQCGADVDVTLVQTALHDAHVECNSELRQSQINDSHSGTTAVGVYIYDGRMTICNVGDSRILLGTDNKSITGPKVQAVPLSKDHTPYRSDEANRCIQSGARILSFGQIDPSTKEEGDSDIEDPPRVWAKNGHYPGTAFTRSIGDSVAERFGVCAEPEMFTLPISPTERLLVLASDGVFDVMSNQQVVDLCYQHRRDPEEACKAVVEKSHEEWLLNDDCCEDEANYDDMTCVIIFFDHGDDDLETESETPQASAEQLPRRPHKRVRQKTLRNLEEMDEEAAAKENFFQS